MKKKQSVRELVTKAVKTHGAIKPKDIIAHVQRPASQVYTMIHKLTKAGYFTKNDNGEVILTGAPARTALKPDIPVAVDEVTGVSAEQVSDMVHEVTSKRRATGLETKLSNELAKANARIEDLQYKLQETSVKYFDAIAVVKYLESKIVTQFGK